MTKPKPITLDELHYYFDAKEKDSIDSGGYSRKSREVLALRDRLLALPDKDFEVTIKAMRSLVESSPKDVEKSEGKKSSDALQLYEDVSKSYSKNVTKVNPV